MDPGLESLVKKLGGVEAWPRRVTNKAGELLRKMNVKLPMGSLKKVNTARFLGPTSRRL